MFGAGDEDDTDFLSPSGGARLASLFGLDQATTGHGNEFFQYTAPKQPKKGQGIVTTGNQTAPKPATTTTGTSSVLFATAVHAYRYINGQYAKQGKFGAAVLGNHTTREYRILLYISQQQPVTVATVHLNFELMVRSSNYSTFYDDQRQNWSIMFESEKAAVAFNKQVCVAKCNSSSSLDSVLCQDLVAAEGPAVDTGDSLEVAYTGWLLQNQMLGQVFDSTANKDKPLRLKLGSGKVVKGLEDGLLGMKKGGKRLIIIPSACAAGSEGVIGWTQPTDSILVFEVEVRRVKFARDSGSDGHSVSSRDSAAPSPVPAADSLPSDPVVTPPITLPLKSGEPALRSKSNSLSEQLTVNTSPDTVKAKLISRMAKMGQPMLPILPPQLDSNDSEPEDTTVVRGAGQSLVTPSVQPSLQPAHPVLPQMATQAPQPSVSGFQTPSAALMQVAPVDSHSAVSGNAQNFQPCAGVQAYTYPQTCSVTSQLQPVRPLYPAPLSQAPHFQGSGDMMSFLMTEARQHNTEIRMAVSKVADKMDHLMTKVEELQKRSSGSSLLLPNMPVTMETSMIMSNIQRIIQENERLKQEVLEKSSRIEEQNDKISELIERNQRYVEQSNLMLEKRNNSLQTATENTQLSTSTVDIVPGWQSESSHYHAKVTEELAAATARVSHLQLKITAHQKKETELQVQLTESLKETELLRGQVTRLQADLAELREASEQTQSRFKSEKQSRRQLELKVTSLEEELTDLRAEKESLEKNLSERKKKSAQERCQAEEEMDEIRKSHQEELDRLRQLLKKARVSTDQATAEQLSLAQAELQSQWEAKCEHLLASAKDEHLQQYREVCAQRDAQQQKLSRLQDECTALQAQVTALTAQNEHLQQLEKNKSQAPAVRAAADPSEKVKKIMNQVFQSLRGEFELEESYDGRTILRTIMHTIKMVTLQLLNQQEEEQGEYSSEEEEEKPSRPSLEKPGPATPELSPAPPSGEMQEAPKVLSEQVAGETTPLPPQDIPMPQNGTQTRKEESSEAETSSEMKDSSLPPEPAGIPSHRVLGPPTSIPPKPPGPVTVDSECEEALADDQRAVQPDNPLGEEHVREVAPDGPLQGNSRRLSLTPDPEKGEPPALDPESPGEPQPPELREVEDVSSSGPPEALLDTELASAASGASLRHNQDSQNCSLSGDEEDELFKGATLKVPRPKVQPEEEDEDEVVRKSQALLSPHGTIWGLFPAGSEKRKGVCWWPTSWTLCTGPCGSELGVQSGQLCKQSGDGQLPLYS
ncbi:FK506-binding protein 15 isoform X1 [Peromyscus californicus insignis]|uniref:FK506-binding protein 15 isoform X1 n=1 Tax=Peromyscus californicus insignis TaxID=564181 RepID=UPI0022A78FAF|nr:FK506-binding protein 15 isoform X1 [Peromyscus californicus insignis]